MSLKYNFHYQTLDVSLRIVELYSRHISFSDCNIDSYDDIFINLCHLCYNYHGKELALYRVLTF